MSTGVLRGKTAIIIGSGRGIGRAISIAFAREGCNLVLASRTAEEISHTSDLCLPSGIEVITVPTDISSWKQVQELVRRAIDRMEKIDILVNCAGIHGPIGPAFDVDPDNWKKAIDINLVGTLNICRGVLPHMIGNQRGKIILLGGGGAASPMPFFSAYAASKAGMVRLAETLASELKPHNIQVNVIAPGMVDTRLQDNVIAAGERAGEEYQKTLRARESKEGFVPPDIAASLAVFLASHLSGSLTGKLISAPHDPWQSWGDRGEELNSSPLYTLRRLDPFTIKPILEDLE
jgi:NAD(P)-dependent dehydrogenase (short-subunit alcohol dehydrogenase family)